MSSKINIPEVGSEVVVHWQMRHGSRVDEITKSTIKSIGKKWVVLENGERFAIGDRWIMDGGSYSSPGECFRDLAGYEDRILRTKLWNEIRSRMGHTPSDGVTLAAIKQAAELLGIDATQHSARSSA